GVELVRVVENGRLRRPGGANIVVARHRVDELRERFRLETGGALLDHPHPEVDVAQQTPFGCGLERRSWRELQRPPDIVEERCGDEEVRAKPWVELAKLTADRGDADGVLEQAAGVGVMALRRRREQPEPVPRLTVEDGGNGFPEP